MAIHAQSGADAAGLSPRAARRPPPLCRRLCRPQAGAPLLSPRLPLLLDSEPRLAAALFRRLPSGTPHRCTPPLRRPGAAARRPARPLSPRHLCVANPRMRCRLRFRQPPWTELQTKSSVSVSHAVPAEPLQARGRSAVTFRRGPAFALCLECRFGSASSVCAPSDAHEGLTVFALQRASQGSGRSLHSVTRIRSPQNRNPRLV
ncbi:unnamed protein product [Rangifer tarandus platyrhynchus]|uniref:Uncharacterized protein n=2 Tax=Rangifer tarandus platyrhynchus TaxID=3082113 RepID=A0ACB0E6T4_RANTA|nr:unnamed protein product [Rangifer tarandus platyrhynchus]CAI9695976.1 unnamed protein product [Rangifer tarandus platyrhynchus]